MSLLFSSYQLGTLSLRNRILMSPMQQYCGTSDAHAVAQHVSHYGRRAEGGVGMVFVEATCVASQGRLMQSDIGLFKDDQVAPLRRVVDAIHAHSVPAAAQLVHGGRKSISHEGSTPVAPSAIGYGDKKYPEPRPMDLRDIAEAIESFAAAATRAKRAGFDAIEIHAAHGFLIHQFLSPLSNERKDAYGGSQEARSRFLKEVLSAVRESAGSGFPLLIRVSATDYRPGGLTPPMVAEAVKAANTMDLAAVDVSAGGLLPVAPASTGPNYQVAFASEIRQRTGLPVIAVGNIRSAKESEGFLRDGHADLIAVGRPLLDDPDYAEGWQRELRLQTAAISS
jgi:NADPH2 dehydrogenase